MDNKITREELIANKGISISAIARKFNISEVHLFTQIQDKILKDKYIRFNYVPTNVDILTQIIYLAKKIVDKKDSVYGVTKIEAVKKSKQSKNHINKEIDFKKREIKLLEKKYNLIKLKGNPVVEYCRLYNLKFYDGYIKYRHSDIKYEISFSLKSLNKIAENISDQVEILNYGDRIQIPEESIAKIFQLIKNKANNDFGFNYLFDATYVCPWSNIIFEEGFIKFYPPRNKYLSDICTPYIVNDSNSKSCFNKIKEYLKKAFGDIKVKAQNNEIYEVVSEIKLLKVIDIDDQEYHLKFPDLLKDERTIDHHKQKYHVDVEFNFAKACLIDAALILEHIKGQKSKYLDELCNWQLDGYNILLANERQITVSGGDLNRHDQVAFMFTIKELHACSWIVFENVEFDKSSYVFIVKTDDYLDAVQFIFDYFNSDIPNKRTSIYAYRNLFKSAGIVSFFRKLHIYIPTWKQNLLSGNMVAKYSDLDFN